MTKKLPLWDLPAGVFSGSLPGELPDSPKLLRLGRMLLPVIVSAILNFHTDLLKKS